MAGRYEDRWQQFAPSRPIPVDDGLATSKQRGAMAHQWWSKRFVDVLDSYGMEGRMQRGRRYARTGQVMTLEVEPGLVASQVQGSRSTPYLVTIRLPEISDEQWGAIDARLADELGTVAAMLAGDVPPALLDVFVEVGAELFPAQWSDLRASCSCPDSESPCKHLAAVLYVLADRVEDDPWILLTWRGRTRDQVVELLRGHQAPAAGPEIAPWWPFAPGPVPHELRFASVDDWPANSGGDPAAVLQHLDDLEVAVRGTAACELIAEAYPALRDEPAP